MMNIQEFKKVIETRVFMRSSAELSIAPRKPGEYRDSKWFFDFRSVIFEPYWLEFFAETFWNRYESKYPFQVGGLESASIPLITAIALAGIKRNKPVNSFFIRKSRKRDGLMRMFEGTLSDHPVIIVDDALNSGSSINRQVLALLEMKKKISDIFVILGFRSSEAYPLARTHDISIASIFTLEDFGIPLLPTTAPEIAKESFFTQWRFSGGHPSFNFILQKSAPVIDKTRLYVGSDDGTFYALDQENGTVIWQFKIGPHPKGKGIFSTPTLHAGLVYFGGYDGNVYALDKAAGKPVWTYAEADWVGSSPVIAPDLELLYIGLEYSHPRAKGGIVALDMTTGRKIWGHTMRGFTHGTPLYIQEKSLVIIGSGEEVVYAFDARTGVLKWEYRTNGDIKSSFAYDAKRKLVLFGSWDGHLYALRADDGECVFSYKTFTPIFSTPLVYGDVVFLASLDKFLYAIDLDSGLPRWHFQTRGRIFSTPVLADGSVWIGSNDACLYEIDPEHGTLRSFFQTPERIVNAIAYNAKTAKFFVPTVANEIYCIKRKDTETP